ncbi:MAG: RelA/SpoT domain protein [Lachnospiraceae bacterium]|nr:RelA/SpoT domain protein [Lachnospiraceae bacterium]
MTFEEYYGEAYPVLKQTEKELLNLIREYQINLTETYQGREKIAEETVEESAEETLKETVKESEDLQPILYCRSRIKSPESMMAKLKKQGFHTDCATALLKMHDAVGVRIVCSFVDDVYAVAEWLCGREEFDVVEKKDYIAWPKPNGYRSLHLILRMSKGAGQGMQAEIQIRTIAIDFWAALEHQMKYKREVEHERLMREELKRCADEIMSVDMSMQAIRDFIRNENNCFA